MTRRHARGRDRREERALANIARDIARDNAHRNRRQAARTRDVTTRYGRLDQTTGEPARCQTGGTRESVIYDTADDANRALDSLQRIGHDMLQGIYKCPKTPDDPHYHVSRYPTPEGTT